MTVVIDQAVAESAKHWDALPDPRRDLHAQDPELFTAIEQEWLRQQTGIELIASENYVSPAVLAALGLSLIHI